ncbi:glutaminase [Aliidongia dinghuensis]|uniref:Glutaminase n=1 Tax=Aliidongia dinghuensis TaxID=1867774 RepID=A0A8J2YUP6_9PROT|nr:glutaminase [Aliidongia dinghuensis]GGF17530.1 glutaminase [Aliidongia dinghuensis]
MEYSELLENIVHEIRPYFGRGKVADYIPALANVPPAKFGMAIATIDGAVHTIGEAEEPFSIQSISKAFTLMLAMRLVGDELWTRLGKEPSGSKFNSLVQLEYEEGVPRNPFINAGALVVTDCVMSHCRAPRNAIRDYARVLSRNFAADFDLEVALSERETGFTNAALANLLASHGRLDNPVAAVLDTYFHQCALAMSCADLARAFLPLANRGISPILEEAVLTERQAKRINALMLTCGMYESVGSFAYRVGLPAKSGVGGGIVAVLPGKFCVAVWSPELDRSGNSLVGTAALEALTRLTQLSIF